eukprot:15437309-Alexandrium_andersonii.AAC.1
MSQIQAHAVSQLWRMTEETHLSLCLHGTPGQASSGGSSSVRGSIGGIRNLAKRVLGQVGSEARATLPFRMMSAA